MNNSTHDDGTTAPETAVPDAAAAPAPTLGPGLDLGPGLHLEPPDTQPVTSIPTITYPSLPDRYTLADDAPDVAAPVTPAPAGSPAAMAPAPTPTVAPAETAARLRRSPRIRTIVVGLVLLAISVLSLLTLLADVRVDGGAVGLALLIGAGAALVAGGVAAAAREAKGGPGGVR